MFFSYSFAYPIFLYLGLPIIIFIGAGHWKYYKHAIYNFNFVNEIAENTNSNIFLNKFIIFFLRFLSLIILCLSIARPQRADSRSTLRVEGIDIMMVMDVSGSMQCFDDLNDRRSRFSVAQSEAINFINKRVNDSLGLVIFAKDIVTRCPLTFDKKILSKIVSDLELGQIEHSHTLMCRSLVSAISRLEHSSSKTKIIILLTDGEPSPEDISALIPIQMAQKLGIKIYTIGVGSDQGGYIERPFFGIVPCGSRLNTQLLDEIAKKTGGKFFYAKSPKDIANIYSTIDQLEKSVIDAPIYTKYKDYFWNLLILAFVILFFENVLATTVLSRL